MGSDVPALANGRDRWSGLDIVSKSWMLVLGVVGIFVIINLTLVPRLVDWQRAARLAKAHGEVIHETHSLFGHLRVREKDSQRSLLFVDPDGREQLQSQIDLNQPGQLQLGYTRALFASFLVQPDQSSVLIVGLGGGGMVRFLRENEPEIEVTAVEIDPKVVSLAAEFFGTREGPRTRILTEDAFVFLRETAESFDVIYMDAFLRPPEAEQELQDKAQRLKTTAFLGQLRQRLRPGGVVAFNLIESDATTAADLASIREVFSPVYVFQVAETGNLAVIGATGGDRLNREELQNRAIRRTRDSKGEASLDLETVVEGLREDEEAQSIPST